jgi:PAS domain S-box-containing protein/putative nucleotidyltransferase with HDIG domain
MTGQSSLETREGQLEDDDGHLTYEAGRLLMDSATGAAGILQDGVIKHVNTAILELTDYSEPDLISRHFMDFIHPDDQRMVAERYAQRLNGNRIPSAYSFRIIDKHGTIHWVQINALVLHRGKRPTILAFLNDITDRQEAGKRVEQSLEKLQRSMEGAIQAVAATVEWRDPFTAGHQRRVARLASAIAWEMHFSPEQIEVVRMAGLLHDIGKVAVPAEIMAKPGRLTATEMALIRVHPQVGYEILGTVDFPWPIADMVVQHHERIDGSGYPAGLHEEEILIEARILAVADVVEAMTADRPYRKAPGLDKALEEISQNSGRLYDADVVYACLRLFNQRGFTFDEQPCQPLSSLD